MFLISPFVFSIVLGHGCELCVQFGVLAVPFVSENECYSSDNWLQHLKNVLHFLSFCEGGN